MTQQEINRKELLKIFGRELCKDDREIVVSPFDGNYGLAGFVLVVNGSPCRALIVYEKGSSDFIIKAVKPTRFSRGSINLAASQTSKVERISDIDKLSVVHDFLTFMGHIKS
jgi:hypothetical protein